MFYAIQAVNHVQEQVQVNVPNANKDIIFLEVFAIQVNYFELIIIQLQLMRVSIGIIQVYPVIVAHIQDYYLDINRLKQENTLDINLTQFIQEIIMVIVLK
jgi:hypothetical protein